MECSARFLFAVLWLGAIPANARDLQTDKAAKRETGFTARDDKSDMNQAKADYLKAKKDYGSHHSVTLDLKRRYEAARETYRKSADKDQAAAVKVDVKVEESQTSIDRAQDPVSPK
jgi:hypothetical protein